MFQILEDPASTARLLGTVPLARPNVLVAPAGIPLPGGDALFAYSEFDVVHRGARPCLVLDESLCVATTMLALYVDGTGDTPAQHAVRFDTSTSTSRPARLTPSDALPPLDRPALVRCGDEVWLAAEVVVESGDAGRVRETAVMVLPAACVVEADTGG